MWYAIYLTWSVFNFSLQCGPLKPFVELFKSLIFIISTNSNSILQFRNHRPNNATKQWALDFFPFWFYYAIASCLLPTATLLSFHKIHKNKIKCESKKVYKMSTYYQTIVCSCSCKWNCYLIHIHLLQCSGGWWITHRPSPSAHRNESSQRISRYMQNKYIDGGCNRCVCKPMTEISWIKWRWIHIARTSSKSDGSTQSTYNNIWIIFKFNLPKTVCIKSQFENPRAWKLWLFESKNWTIKSGPSITS